MIKNVSLLLSRESSSKQGPRGRLVQTKSISNGSRRKWRWINNWWITSLCNETGYRCRLRKDPFHHHAKQTGQIAIFTRSGMTRHKTGIFWAYERFTFLSQLVTPCHTLSHLVGVILWIWWNSVCFLSSACVYECLHECQFNTKTSRPPPPLFWFLSAMNFLLCCCWYHCLLWLLVTRHWFSFIDRTTFRDAISCGCF